MGAPVFLAYQQRLTASVSAHAVTVVEKSRRTGYSWSLGAVAVLTAAAQKSAGGQDVFYIGYNLEMAREFIDYVGEWGKAFSAAADSVEEVLFDDGENSIKAFRVTFASGFKVLALPSRPRSLRGMQGLVMIDEAAFHDDLKELLKAAFALLIWGGKVVVVSTHDGAENPFNELVTDIRAGRLPYHLERCTFDDALADGLYKRICKVKGRKWSMAAQAKWRAEIIAFYGDGADEELFCIPREGGGAFLSGALVEGCMDAALPVLRWEMPNSFERLPDHLREAEARAWCETHLDPVLAGLDPDLTSFFGEDFGRNGDLTVIWPVQITRMLDRRTPFLVELRNIPFRQQEQVLIHICARLPRFGGGALDARGNGQYLAERAMQRYGGCIQRVMLTVEWYRANMPPYKAAYEDRTIVVPKDADVLADHRDLVMDKGVARPTERSKGRDGKQRHGDSAVAGALALFASRQPVAEYDYLSAAETPPARGSFHRPDEDEEDTRRGLGFGAGGW